MTKLSIRAASLALTSALLVALAPAAKAANPLTGDLFFTTFNTQSNGPGPNLYSVHFTYNGSSSLVLNVPCLVSNLVGADGLIFDPTDTTFKTLIVGEQNSNRVAAVGVSGTPPCTQSSLFETKAVNTAPFGLNQGQAYGLATPDNKTLWMLPNDLNPDPNHINVAALPLTATGGTAFAVTGADGTGTGNNPSLRGVTFIGTQGYYGDANDKALDGHFGTISAAFVTVRVAVVDDTVAGTTDLNGSLPTHGMTTDLYSGCIIASGADQIWQLCPPGVLGSANDGKFHVRAKISTTAVDGPGSGSNWDQTSTDLAGHLFAANNDGNLFFVDYSNSASKLINNNLGGPAPVFTNEQFLATDLDDIINGGGAPPPPPPPPPGTGCPATQGFWHKTANWPNVTKTIDGVIYNGGTDHSFVIGGITYTQAQIAALLPSGSLHTGGYVNTLSQFVAAVLNLAAGAKPSTIDSTISAINTDLTGVTILGPGVKLAPISSSLQATISGFEDTLDNYNSAVGLKCSEGVGLNTGSGK